MPRTRIKFCGITRPADALAAAEAGADAVGMVLHASTARKITIDMARQIMQVLPPFVTPVGLFVDATAEAIRAIANDLGLRHIQLHGHESPAMLQSLPTRVIIKAIKLNELDQWRNLTGLAGLLLDTGGGTGVENDWQAMGDLKQSGGFAGLPPIILAGGLTPQNVGPVVKFLKPFAVDVSSGIESAPGIKSVEKMRDFVLAVRGN